MPNIPALESSVARLNVLLRKEYAALQTVDVLSEQVERVLQELENIPQLRNEVRAVPHSEMRSDFNAVRERFEAVAKRFGTIARKAKQLKYEGE